MSGKISGIYVEIRGDYKQLKEDLSQAKAIVTQQSKGMSDALNNALSPDQIKKSVDKMVGSLNTLSNASKIANRSFDGIGVNLKQYSTLVGVTEKEFAKLQSRMIQTSAAKAQETALRDIAKAADLSAKEVAQLGKQMGVSAAGIAAVNGASRSASSSLAMLGSAARASLAYFSVYTVIEFGRAIRDAGLSMDSLQRSFVAVTGSQADAAETLSFLREEAGRLGQNFYALAPEFKNVMAAARGTAMEGENVRKMFSAIAGASTALGLSVDDTHGTLRALQQMMSKGKIQAEELRGQLGERLPGALNLMAKAMGVSTAELNKMMEDGKLLSDEALPKLTTEIERVYGAAAETAALESGRAAVNRLSQEWTDLKTNLYDNDAFVAATNAITDMVAGMNALIEGRGSVLETLGAMQSDNGMLSAMFPSRFAYDFFAKYADSAKEASNDVRESFTSTWQELERLNMAQANNFIQKEEEKAAVVAKTNAETLEQFRKQSQTQLQRLDEDKARYLAAAKGNRSKELEIESWYAAEVAKLNEKSTKKFLDEQKKQLEAHKKAREAMRKNEAETLSAIDKWMNDYEQRQIEAVANGVAERKKLREDEAKAAADAARKIAEEQEAAAQKVMDRIQEGTADVFYDMFQDIGKGWETLWASMKNWALRTLAELAARAATVQIVVPIMTSMTGTANATQAVQAITGGQGGGFNLSSLSSLVQPGSMLSKIPGMNALTGILGSNLPGTATTLIAPGGQAATFGGLSLGPALGYGAAGSLGYSLLGGALGLPQNQWSGIMSSLGGSLGAWGGAALGATLGGTAGSVLPIVGTAAGAALGGIMSSMFGGNEGSPSVIFQGQTTRWGQTEGFEFHTKSGGSKSQGRKIAAALGSVAGDVFATVEASLNSIGEGYVGLLKDATVTWGRKVEKEYGAWDFGADMDFEEIFAKASASLQRQIYKSAAGAFSVAGQDVVGTASTAKAMLDMDSGVGQQFSGLLDAVSAGVQSGDVETFAAQIVSLKQAIDTTTGAWDAVQVAVSRGIEGYSQYQSVIDQSNASVDQWVAQLTALGFAQDRISEIESARTAIIDAALAPMRAAFDQEMRLREAQLSGNEDLIAKTQLAVRHEQELSQIRAAWGEDSAQYAAVVGLQSREMAALAASLGDVADAVSTVTDAQRRAYGQDVQIREAQLSGNQDLVTITRLRIQQENELAEVMETFGRGSNELGKTVELQAREMAAAQAKIAQAAADSAATMAAEAAALAKQRAERALTFDQDARAREARLSGDENLIAMTEMLVAQERELASVREEWGEGSVQLATVLGLQSRELAQAEQERASAAEAAKQALEEAALAEHERIESLRVALSQDIRQRRAALTGDSEFVSTTTLQIQHERELAAARSEWGADSAELAQLLSLQADETSNLISELAAAAAAAAADMQSALMAFGQDVTMRRANLSGDDELIAATRMQIDHENELAEIRAKWGEGSVQLATVMALQADELTSLHTQFADAAAEAAGALASGIEALRLSFDQNARIRETQLTGDQELASITSMLVDQERELAEARKNFGVESAEVTRLTTIQAGEMLALTRQFADQAVSGARTDLDEARDAEVVRLQAIIADQMAKLQSARANLDAAFQAESDRLQSIAAAADAELNARRSALESAYQSEITRLQGVVSSHERTVAERREVLISAYREESAELRETADRMRFLGKTIQDWRASFLSGQDSPLTTAQRTDRLSAAFQSTLARAIGGDASAMEGLPQSAGDYLSVSREMSSTREEYARLTAQVLAGLQQTEGVAETAASSADRQLQVLEASMSGIAKIVEEEQTFTAAFAAFAQAQADKSGVDATAAMAQIEGQMKAVGLMQEQIDFAKALAEYQSQVADTSAATARRQLEILTEQYEALDGTRKSVSSIGEAMDEYRAAASNQAAEIAEEEISALNQSVDALLDIDDSVLSVRDAIIALHAALAERDGLTVPGYASGGYFSGGLRIVGENGPEIEATGPSRIWTATETASMLRGNGSDAALLQELRQLRGELMAANANLAQNTRATATTLRRWDADGLPESREAV